MENLTEFKPENYIRTKEEAVLYLRDAIDSGDHRVVAAALGTIARASNMSTLAADVGMTRAGLYKTLSKDGNPSLSTLMAALNALGLELNIVERADETEYLK